MADHSELIAEMAQMDKMSTQERLKLAKRRRMQQLKKWSQREKEYNSSKRKKDQLAVKNARKHDYKVHFVPSVMLLEAAARNDIEEVKRLLMLGVSPDSTNEDGLTALHQCCIDDSEEMMKLLLDFGANVNAKDSEQWTPLHAAATCGHLHIVKYLISKGADLLAVNADGNMPYDICDDDATLDYIENEMASRGVTQEMIDETRASTENHMLKDLKNLVKDGKDLDSDDNGATPLHVAAANGYLTVIEFLLDNHASVDVCDIDQWQPIHAAACWGHPDALELLVQAGADLNAKTKNGETPYDISEDLEVKERIMQLKYEMETKRSHGDKLRRTHSQNTRSQSIRRTSIREKAQISRREAREEARIRQEKEEQDSLCDDDESKQHLDSLTKEYAMLPEIDLQDIDISFLPLGAKDTLQRFKAKAACEMLEHKDSVNKTNNRLNSKYDSHDISNGDNMKDDSSHLNRNATKNSADNEKRPVPLNGDTAMHVTQISNIPQASEAVSFVQQNSGQSVNVEIHVTVNTSPAYASSQGTLSDLKKQRCDQRHRSSISSNSSQQETQSKSLTQNGHFNKACEYDSPPSPTSMPRKYVGDPLEIVGDKKRKSRCCNLM